MRNVIQWDLNSFFFQKLTKIAQRLGALPPDPHSHRRLVALPPDPPSLIRFSTISFRPLPLPKSWQSAIRLRLQIFHSTISLPHKKLLFRKFLMTSLRVICGLGPPQSKILATPMVPTYRIRIITKNAYLTSVPYFLEKIEGYRTSPYLPTVPYCHSCF